MSNYNEGLFFLENNIRGKFTFLGGAGSEFGKMALHPRASETDRPVRGKNLYLKHAHMGVQDGHRVKEEI